MSTHPSVYYEEGKKAIEEKDLEKAARLFRLALGTEHEDSSWLARFADKNYINENKEDKEIKKLTDRVTDMLKFFHKNYDQPFTYYYMLGSKFPERPENQTIEEAFNKNHEAFLNFINRDLASTDKTDNMFGLDCANELIRADILDKYSAEKTQILAAKALYGARVIASGDYFGNSKYLLKNGVVADLLETLPKHLTSEQNFKISEILNPQANSLLKEIVDNNELNEDELNTKSKEHLEMAKQQKAKENKQEVKQESKQSNLTSHSMWNTTTNSETETKEIKQARKRPGQVS